MVLNSDKKYFLGKLLASSEVELFSCHKDALPSEPIVPYESAALIETRYGKDIVYCLGEAKDPELIDKLPMRKFISWDTEAEIEENRILEKKLPAVLKKSRALVREFGLKMKIISAHFLSKENKILFFFTAENRVDFRTLAATMGRTFKARIELRQLGARESIRILGGYGTCGRPLCCTSFLYKLPSVPISVIKKQGLDLSANNINGVCGRLRCCFIYEVSASENAKKYEGKPSCLCHKGSD